MSVKRFPDSFFEYDGAYTDMPSPKSTSTKKHDAKIGTKENADNFKRNVATLLAFVPDDQHRRITASTGITEVKLKLWQNKGVAVKKITGPIAMFCQVLGANPHTMWDAEVKFVGPILIDQFLGIKPFKR